MDATFIIQLNSYQDTASFSTMVIAIATTACAIFSFILWRATKSSPEETRKVFETANRPQVGIHNCKFEYDNRRLRIETEIKNFGDVSAIDVHAHWRVVLNDKSLPTAKNINSCGVLPPQAITLIKTISNPGENTQVSDIKSELHVLFNLSYKDAANQEYYYREWLYYDQDVKMFINMGSDAN
jgi:hypothetical protein